MNVALVTTTINVPYVLAAYRKLFTGMIIVAGDQKTPPEAVSFCKTYGVTYLTPDDQSAWSSSSLIGWNTDSRRNFAVLAALECGADLIITVDDDMIPSTTFFDRWERIFSGSYSGLQFGAPGKWFDHGQLSMPPAPARGLPVEPTLDHSPSYIHGVNIGMAQGAILGVPDTDACTAIAQKPFITGVSDILRYGFVANQDAHAVCNSQITAFRRELAPYAGQFYPWQGRNTDILASLYMRWMARHLGFYTHYGLPMAFHARKKRPLINDLSSEMIGLRTIEGFAQDCLGEKEPQMPLVPDVVLDAWREDCLKALA